MRETIDQICADLHEGNRAAVKRVVTAIGVESSLALLQQTLEVETKGGMRTRDGQRRRTPGGVFFQLARAVVPKELHAQVFPMGYVLRREKRRREGANQQNEGRETGAAERQARQDGAAQDIVVPVTTRESEPHQPSTETAATIPVPRAPVALPMTWEEAKALIAQVLKTPGEARTVKLTLIGRPQKVIAQQECVVVSLKGKEPSSLPKGLPLVPQGSAITWAVFVVNKQWNKVKARIEANPEDALIIEGYPLVGKNGVAAILALTCKSVLREKAARDQKQAGA